jgi:inner membrane protein
MDPLTQVALGSAIGTVTLGRKIVARKAAIVGGVIAELPDLDVFLPSDTVLDAFIDHRGPTHSVLIQFLAMPVFGELLRRLDPRLRTERWLCYGVAFALMSTHALLDGFTTYGTKLLWPLFTEPISWSSIFIIDPLYTLPLLVALFVSLFSPARQGPTVLGQGARRTASWALILSSAYMGWTLAARELAETRVLAAVADAGVSYQRMTMIPMPFNSLVWRGLLVDGESYTNIYVSLLDEPGATVPLHRHPRNPDLADALSDREAVRKIAWFSHGFYALKREGDAVLISDLRLGVEPNYVFTFRIGQFNSDNAIPVRPTRAQNSPDWSQLGWLWRRMFDPAATRTE